MKITGSRVADLSNYIDFRIKYLPAGRQAGQKQRRISNELKELIKKYL